MKKAFHILALTTALTLTGFAVDGAESLRRQAEVNSALEPRSTCWLTCFSLNGGGVRQYKAFNVTKFACCSNAALNCPPGWKSAQPAWGEPAELCPFNEM